MIELGYILDGSPVAIHVPETESDLDEFREFIRANHLGPMGVDTETTGLDIYSPGFRVRTVQFGCRNEAWVIQVERGGRFLDDAVRAVRSLSNMIIHNASYDLQVFDRCFDYDLEQSYRWTTDTRILAHLVDPRGREEGGVGHSLEDLTREHLDETVAEEVKGSMAVLARRYKTTKAKIWEVVDINDEDYLLYAGMDPILAWRLASALKPMVPASSVDLINFEHDLAKVCAVMSRTGFLVDTDYCKLLVEDLWYEQDEWEAVALDYGVENVMATEQVADALESCGHKFTEFTPSGKRKVDKVLLERLAADGNVIAESVIKAKYARKQRTTWVEKFLESADEDNRCHASINPLRARTARMSITGIPAQTLPSGKGEFQIRRCFVAEPDHQIVSVDYQSQELRVLAALANDQVMINAFRNGDDLHQITGDAAGVTRDIGKMANFLTVYGGGPGALSAQAKIELAKAKHVLDTFNKTYPGVKALSNKLAKSAGWSGSITTPTGRVLPVDKSRAYSAVNYLVQSTSRDVTARALIRLYKAGYGPYLRLPIHDEVLLSMPSNHSERGAGDVARIMTETMGSVVIGTDAEVGKRSWGSLYGSPY